MLRIANIIESNFNDQYSLISKKQFDNLYEECSNYERKSIKINALDETDFAKFLVKLSILII